MSNEKQFLGWLPFANFALAVLVVFIHSYNAKDYGLNYADSSRYIILWLEDFISHDLAHLAVPLFMTISGYLFYRTATFDTLKEKLNRRVKSLLIPYLLWNCIYFVLYLAMTNIHLISDYLQSVETVHLTFHDFIAGVLFYKNNGIMWFLYQLIIYVLLSPVLLLVLKNKIISLSFYTLLVILYSTHFFQIPNLSSNTMAFGIFPDMLSYYFLGALLAVNKDIHKLFTPKIGVVLVLIGQIVWFFNYAGYKLWHIYFFNWLFITLSLLGIIMILFTSKKALPCKWGGGIFLYFYGASIPIGVYPESGLYHTAKDGSFSWL